MQLIIVTSLQMSIVNFSSIDYCRPLFTSRNKTCNNCCSTVKLRWAILPNNILRIRWVQKTP